MTNSVFGVTFLLCCHNSAPRLPRTLACLARLNPSPHPWEILVVDNASTDQTARIAQKTAAELGITVKIVTEARLGLMHARIRGLQEAAYDIVTFVDDDNWLAPDWLLRAVSIFSALPGVGACGAMGTAVSDLPLPSWFAKYQHAYAVGPQATASEGSSPGPNVLYGAGLSVRRQALLTLFDCGFRPLLTGRRGSALTSGEDGEICLALRLAGWTLWFEPGLRFQHYLPSHRLEWRHLRRLYRGFGAASVSLDAYYFALESPRTHALDIIRRSWANQCGGAVKALGAASWGLRRQAEGSEAELRREYWLGRVWGLLRIAGSYPETIQGLPRWAAPVRRPPCEG